MEGTGCPFLPFHVFLVELFLSVLFCVQESEAGSYDAYDAHVILL